MGIDEVKWERVVAHMATTNTYLENIDKRLDNVEKKQDNMAVNGCAKGHANEDRIKILEEAPRKGLAGAGATGGGIAASILVAYEIIKNLA